VNVKFLNGEISGYINLEKLLVELLTELKNQGAHMITVLDISAVPLENRRGLDYAIVYTIPLYPENDLSWPAFDRAEKKGEALAEWLARELIFLGYEAYPHTLKNVFNNKTLSSLLPNKTLAVMAGSGWIGKNSLFINPEYGSALSIAAVLTNMPLPTQNATPMASRCGDCNICRDVCVPGAIKGRLWEPGLPREELLDAFCCTECFQCLAQCPWNRISRG